MEFGGFRGDGVTDDGRIVVTCTHAELGCEFDVDITPEVLRVSLSGMAYDVLSRLGLSRTLAVFDEEVDKSPMKIADCLVVTPGKFEGVRLRDAMQTMEMNALSDEERQSKIDEIVGEFASSLDGMFDVDGASVSELLGESKTSSDARGDVIRDVEYVGSIVGRNMNQAGVPIEHNEVCSYVADLLAQRTGEQCLSWVLDGGPCPSEISRLVCDTAAAMRADVS